MKRIKRKKPEGAALLVVLFVVMAITVLSLGFMSRSDVELACGKNMILRTQMVHLAESGLEHARGLILSPQDVSTEYWQGDVRQQLVPGSDDYYDVNVVKLGECNYQMTCTAYREKNGVRVGRSGLEAELRLDPCIAFWSGVDTTISQQITINGDLYCAGNLSNNGSIIGDVFAGGSITGANITGQKNESVAQPPVAWTGLNVGDFSTSYYFNGLLYSVQEVADGNYSGVSWGTSSENPAGIYYCSGNLELEGNVIINGTLVVNGKLKISGAGNAISAVKNFPAIIVGDHLDIEKSAGMTVEGLVQSEDGLHIKATAQNAVIEITGGLFAKNKGIWGNNSDFGYITITAAPTKASIQVWSTVNTANSWSPAAGAFFRSIEGK